MGTTTDIVTRYYTESQILRFNTQQALDLAGIRREQFRHWKKVLPPLAGRDGRADDYSLEEIIALAILAALVLRLGIGVSHLADFAVELFDRTGTVSQADSLPSRVYLTADGTFLNSEPAEGAVYSVVRAVDIRSNVLDRITASPLLRQLPLPL